MLMLLCSTMAFSQLVKVDVNLDSIASIISKKDKEIKKLMKLNANINSTLTDCEDVNTLLLQEVDVLKWYKMYYMHSKHVITPRVIGRIEEMVNEAKTN